MEDCRKTLNKPNDSNLPNRHILQINLYFTKGQTLDGVRNSASLHTDEICTST
jgi:hypothetical protein